MEDDVLEQIGNTPVIEIFEDLPGEVYTKMERYNPSGSMKDRVVLNMIEDAEENGELEEGDTLVEASSGNTGGAMALVCARKGYDCVIVVPPDISEHKVGYMQAAGADVRVNRDYMGHAEDLAEELDAVHLNQYVNQANPGAHYETTGKELFEQIPNKPDYVVCTMGGGGTMSGVAKRTKEVDPNIATIGVDAEDSNISRVYDGKDPINDHDSRVSGLGKDGDYDTMWFAYIDDIRVVNDDDVMELTNEFAREGIFMGPSGAAAALIARSIVTHDEHAVVATVACDGLEQYWDQMRLEFNW